MLRANTWGLGMFVVGGLLAGFASLVLKWEDAAVFIAVGVVLIVMDVVLRLRSTYVPLWPISREASGHLLYIPVWIIGGVVLVINLARAALA